MEETAIFEHTVLVIGLPQHIAVACAREHSYHVVFEFFDSAGPAGDSPSVKAVRQWSETFLQKHYSLSRPKKVIWTDVTKSVCFQSDKSDVMCQTWIWYWVYWRMVRQANSQEIISHIKENIRKNKSLSHIRKFNTWMIELYKLGYYVSESASEAKSAEKATPMSFEKLVDLKQKKIMKKIEMLEMDLADTQRSRSLKSCASDETMTELDGDLVIKLTLKAPGEGKRK